MIAGIEFEELERFILVFNKALYGLKSIGKRYAETFHDVIKRYRIHALQSRIMCLDKREQGTEVL